MMSCLDQKYNIQNKFKQLKENERQARERQSLTPRNDSRTGNANNKRANHT